MVFKRPAVVIPLVKGLICGTIGGLGLAYSLRPDPYTDILPSIIFVYSVPVLLASFAYVLAAFLVARKRLVWRVFGGLLDGGESLAISWALIGAGMILSEPGFEWPLLISLVVAATWLLTLVPVFVAVLRPTGPATASAGSGP